MKQYLMKGFLFLAVVLCTIVPQAASAQDAASKPSVEIRISQIDTSQYPTIRIYVDIYDSNGKLITNVDKADLKINEKDNSGNLMDVNIDQLYQVAQKEKIAFSLVMDKSGSMEGSKIIDSKAAVKNLVNEIAIRKKDSIEITSFDDYVYMDQEITMDYAKVKGAVDAVQTDAMTALYDAIYAALLRINKQPGPKCVIVFTDGMENASSYTRQDVLKLASLVNVPVYVIGIGNDVSQADLTDLAAKMMGKYYFVGVVNLNKLLTEVYNNIYKMQMNRYAIQYTLPDSSDPDAARVIEINGTKVFGEVQGSDRQYIPKADVNTMFSGTYWDSDYIFPNSSVSSVNESDLRTLSLAELRIARNEIFARHGRQFKDPMLNKWFYSKMWYLKVKPKYSPTAFDNLPNQMSKLEKANINLILKTEKDRTKNSMIFPDAATRILSEYDVSLSKPVLKRALEEIYKSQNVPVGQKAKLSGIMLKNVEQIETILNNPDITY